MLHAAGFSWGSRVASRRTTRRRTSPFPGFLNINSTNDVVDQPDQGRGRHTLKTGFYNTHSYKAQSSGSAAFGHDLNFQQDDVGTNPLDTSFGFANAAIGCFSSYTQASKYVEGSYVYNNTEGYVQDNWKVNSRLTLDYGVRFVHQQPQYDDARPGVELPAREVDASARRRCSTSPAAPTASTRAPAPTARRMNPLTGQFLGPNTTLRDRHARAEHRQPTERPVPGRARASPKTTYTWPALGARRRASAWPTTSPASSRFVLRGGAGLFFDRPTGNSIFAQVLNPPTIAERHRALRPAADARQRRPDDRGAAGAERVRVRQRRCRRRCSGTAACR